MAGMFLWGRSPSLRVRLEQAAPGVERDQILKQPARPTTWPGAAPDSDREESRHRGLAKGSRLLLGPNGSFDPAAEI